MSSNPDPEIRAAQNRVAALRHYNKNKESLNASRRAKRYDPEFYVKFRLDAKKHECKRKGLDFNLTQEWFLAHWSQGCEVTGKDFDLDGDSPWHAQIDRLDGTKGYTMDNCRMVVAIFNQARMNWTDKDVKELASSLKEER